MPLVVRSVTAVWLIVLMCNVYLVSQIQQTGSVMRSSMLKGQRKATVGPVLKARAGCSVTSRESFHSYSHFCLEKNRFDVHFPFNVGLLSALKHRSKHYCQFYLCVVLIRLLSHALF